MLLGPLIVLLVMGAAAPAVSQNADPSVGATRIRPLRVLFVGDSIVQGVGDTLNLGGAVGRLATLLPEVEVASICEAGATSAQVLKIVQQAFLAPSCSLAKEAATAADLVIVMAGTNDHWEGMSPQSSLSSLRHLVSFLRDWYLWHEHSTPNIVIANLLFTQDPYHRRFVGNFNRILVSGAMQGMIAGPRFGQMQPVDFSADGLHPSASGYGKLALAMADYIMSIAINQVARLPLSASLVTSHPWCLVQHPRIVFQLPARKSGRQKAHV